MPAIGEKIYVAECGNHEPRYSVVTVKSISKTGLMTVEYSSGSTLRFNADGKETGKTGYFQHYLDNVTFEERKALLAQTERAKVAAGLIQNIKVNERVNYRWGKETMLTEIDILQARLDAARAAVEAI